MPKNYKLYQTLAILDKKEVRQFKKVLDSPFFVMRQDMKHMFEYLIEYQIRGKSFPENEVVFQTIFPQKKYDYLLLRGAMSDLLKLIEEYLIIIKRRKDAIKTQQILGEIYRNRKLTKSYQVTVKGISNILEKQPLRNEFYFRQLLDFQMEEMDFKMSNQRTKVFNLEEISDTIDVLYLVQKLKHTCHQFTHQQVFKTEYDFGLLPHFMEVIEQEKYLKIPAIAIYYYCYRFLTEQEGTVYFQNFKKILFENKEMFDVQEMKELYLFAINFCIRKWNQGEKKFTVEIFKLYQEGLQAGYFLENGILSRFTFNNVFAAGIVLEEFDWLENFIETYSEKLEDEYRNVTVSFNLARLEFTRKNFEKALLHLQNAEYKDLVNNIISKSLLIKIYFELEEYDALLSHLDSFQIFIRRREVSDFHRLNYMNIIRLVKRLVGLPELDKIMRSQLREEIKAEEVLTEREWLLSKV